LTCINVFAQSPCNLRHALPEDRMTLPEFALACLALLVTPGPTNTLIALRAAQSGAGAALRLVPAELAGYGLAVLPLALFGQAVLAGWPGLAAVLKLAAAIWVAVLALRLWGAGAQGQGGARVGAGQVFATTLLNPKALIFGLVLFPAVPGAGLAELTAIFALCILGVASLWACAAQALLRGNPALVGRAASAVLMVFATLLAQAGLAGVM